MNPLITASGSSWKSRNELDESPGTVNSAQRTVTVAKHTPQRPKKPETGKLFGIITLDEDFPSSSSNDSHDKVSSGTGDNDSTNSQTSQRTRPRRRSTPSAPGSSRTYYDVDLTLSDEDVSIIFASPQNQLSFTDTSAQTKDFVGSFSNAEVQIAMQLELPLFDAVTEDQTLLSGSATPQDGFRLPSEDFSAPALLEAFVLLASPTMDPETISDVPQKVASEDEAYSPLAQNCSEVTPMDWTAGNDMPEENAQETQPDSVLTAMKSLENKKLEDSVHEPQQHLNTSTAMEPLQTGILDVVDINLRDKQDCLEPISMEWLESKFLNESETNLPAPDPNFSKADHNCFPTSRPCDMDQSPMVSSETIGSEIEPLSATSNSGRRTRSKTAAPKVVVQSSGRKKQEIRSKVPRPNTVRVKLPAFETMSSPLEDFLWENAQKAYESEQGLAEATAALNSPTHAMNALLDCEVKFQQLLLNRVANTLRTEMPEMFPTELSFREFYNEAVRAMQESGSLSTFNHYEAVTDEGADMDAASEHCERMLEDLDGLAEDVLTDEVYKPTDPVQNSLVLSGLKTSTQIMAFADTEAVNSSLKNLQNSVSGVCLFLTGAMVIIKGRILNGVSIELKLRHIV